MKISVFLFLVAMSSYASTYSQKTKISLKHDNISIEKVLEEIELLSEFNFIYDDTVVDYKRIVSVEAKNEQISKILKKIFDEGDITFEILDRQIILIKNEIESPQSAPVLIKDVEGENQAPQEILITGTVKDTAGQPLPGVNVIEKGTTNGTSTDFDGKFSLTVASANSVLHFSYIGFSVQETTVGDATTLEITMETDSESLDEVVITAMGIKRDRKDLGYAVTKLDGDDLVKAGVPVNAFSVLQGKAAGVSIRQSVAGPTGGVEVNIRGTNALEFDANTRPLFVIDGVPMYDSESDINNPGGSAERKGDYGSGINDLNALDIESMEILKGAKASVLYGSAGGNGVIIITTKKGRHQEGFGVNVNYQYSIEKPKNYIEFQNEFGSGWNEYDEVYLDVDGVNTRVQNTEAGSFGPAFAGNEDVSMLFWDGKTRNYQAYPDNYMFFYEDGSTESINVAVSNGGAYGNTRFSFTNYEYQGITPDFTQRKNTLSFAGNLNISPKVKVDFSTNYYNIKTQNRISEWAVGMVNGLNRDAPYEDLVNDQKYKVTDPSDPNFGYSYTNDYQDFYDPDYVDGILQARYPEMPMRGAMYFRDYNRYVDQKNHLIGSVRPTIRLTDWLSFVGQASLDLTNTDIENKERPLAVYPDILGGEYRVQKEKAVNQEYRAFLNFDTQVFDDRLKIFAMGGTTFSKQYRDKLYAGIWNTPDRNGFTYPDWYNLGNQAVDIDGNTWPGSANEIGNVRGFITDERKIVSYLGLATFTWDNTYTLEITARNDETSTLDPDNNSYFYSGAALTWNFTNPVKKLIPALQFGKLRASFADIGRDSPSTYFSYQSLEAGPVVTDTDALTVGVDNEIFGGVIKPERKREIEIGTEMNFFKGNRLGIDFSYYNNNVYDQIMTVGLTETSGASAIKVNAGDVQNWGYEVQLNGTPILTQDFRWDLTATMAAQRNKIKELFPGLPQKNIVSVGHGINVVAKEGERSGNIYAVGPRTVEEGEFAGRSIVNSDGVSYDLDSQTDILTGNIYPNLLGGLSSNMSYKGFSLGVFIDYSYGASVYNFADYVLKGTGTSKQSLFGRNEAHGGIGYYIDDTSGDYIPWDHNATAPPVAEDGRVYHDGIIIPGVQADNSGATPVYSENDVIVAAGEYYYTNNVYSTNGTLLDGVNQRYKNDYIKLREVSLLYRFPNNVAKKFKLQNLSLSLFARNIGYFYKTMPNFDAEASTGTKTFKGESVLPSTQSFGFQLSLGI